MQVFAHADLAAAVPPDKDQPRLILEGMPPAAARCADGGKTIVLDELCDGRWAAFDAEAELLAERIAAAVRPPDSRQRSTADVNILRLRYAAVKWLRPLAWRRSLPAAARPKSYELHVSNDSGDAEYVALWQALAAADGCELRIVRLDRAVDAEPPRQLEDSAWRRRLAHWIGRSVSHVHSSAARSRVVLCGNPRLLDPLGRELVRRRIPTAWLYDRFPLRSGLRWAWRGVPTLTCRTEGSRAVTPAELGESIRYDRLDLTEVVRVWLARQSAETGALQSSWVRRVAEHFSTYRPTHVVVDEDATPLKRIVLTAARQVGARSAVVQHGACAIRFGFTPLAADRFLAADNGSLRQLLAWDVPQERIVVTGSPYREQFVAAVRAVRRPAPDPSRRRILLLGTTPPRRRRPDALEFHLTEQTYEQMLVAACAAVAELPHAELILRPHPRTATDDVLRAVLGRFPGMRYRQASARESLAQLVASADCVLSCASSAGIESAAAGVPVVQLLPERSGNILPAEWYGLIGSARTLEELRPLLQIALATEHDRRPQRSSSSAGLIERLVDEVLYAREPGPAPHFIAGKPQEVRRA